MDEAEMLQPTVDPTHFGTGLLPRTPVPGEPVLMALPTAPFDFSKSSGLLEPPDEDQNGSGSCTSQAKSYYEWQWVGIEAVRRDAYSHTHLSGGGAYLDAPGNFDANFGILVRDSVFQDPSPEGETIMETVITSADGNRVKKYSIKQRIVPSFTIDSLAALIDQYKGVIIGVHGSWKPGNWNYPYTDPQFTGVTDWNHALYCYDHVIRNGKKAIVAKSSWCNSVKNHYINEDFFNNGGVFEAIVMEVREITSMEEHFKMNLVGRAGLLHVYGDGGWFEVAANEQEYHDMGTKYHVNTCNLVNGKWVFEPFDFTK